MTAAYARKAPLIASYDIAHFFPRSPLPDPSVHSVRADLQTCLSQNADPQGGATHISVWRASLVLLSWVTAGQRAFATLAMPRPGGPPASMVDDLRRLWSLLDDAHDGARILQEMLLHLEQTPVGCAEDGCTNQHLRLITRLDKDLLVSCPGFSHADHELNL